LRFLSFESFQNGNIFPLLARKKYGQQVLNLRSLIIILKIKKVRMYYVTFSPLNKEFAVMDTLVKLAVMVALNIAIITSPTNTQPNANNRAVNDFGVRSP